MKIRCAMLLAAFFLWNTVFPCSFAEEGAPRQEENTLQDVLSAELAGTPALNPEQIVIYNNIYDPEDPCSPMVYVTGLSLMGTGITVRVYDKYDALTRSLLGSHEVEDTTHGFTVEIPVAELSPMGGTVYVTIQKEDMAESAAVRADYTEARTPYASLETIKIQEKYAYDQKEFAYSQPIFTPKDLKAGSYYLVDVKLTNFHTVGGATIPVRYNTDYLELVPIVPSTKKINTASTVSADKGAWFHFAGVTGGYRASLQCGVLPGFHTDYGTVGAVDKYPVAEGSDLGEYPYLNTRTGLVKLEIMKDKYGSFDYNGGKWSSGTSVVRLVFRAKQNGTALNEMAELVHFATVADYLATGGKLDENGKPKDKDVAATYYATQHPTGISVTLEDAQLLRTPPAITLEDVDFPQERPVEIQAPDLLLMPDSFEEKAAGVTLPESSVKVYNYTNAQSYVSGLDAYLSDRLIISPSQESGGIIYGDHIRVYGNSGLTELLGEGDADPEGAASIDLRNRLLAEGGKVYVTNSRAGVVSSAVAFEYQPEASRDVTFRIYRTALPAGISEGTDPLTNPQALTHVQKGEQFQIRVYFNDINDLMGYTFPIHFNARAVKAADRYFRQVEQDGYMSEADFFSGRTPFSVGNDVGSLTTEELIIYYAQEAEIPDLMRELGISGREEWDRRKQDIQVKIEYGVSGGPGVWNGGILFTGPRGEKVTAGALGADATAYPYVDNNAATGNVSGDGLIKLWATSLTSPVTRLDREEGYHFLTMNFVGVTNVTAENADFRFAKKEDGAYDAANADGGRLVISGPEASAGKNVSFHWEVYSMEEIPTPAGTTVGGMVRSWNPAAETVMTLSQGGEVIYTVTAGGLGRSAATGAGSAVRQNFSLAGVMPGTYTLRLQKKSHVDVFIDELVVGEEPMDLTQHADPRVREITLPCGDVDGDGKIGFRDRERLLLSRYYGKVIALLPEEERAEATLLDLDGDGCVKKLDLLILMAAPNYGKSAVYIDLGE